MLNAMRTNSLDIGTVDFSQLTDVSEPQVARATACSGCPTSAGPATIWNFKDTDRPLQQDHLPALLPPGDGDAGGRAGDHRRDLPRRRRARLRPDPVGPEDAVRAVQFGQSAVPVQPGEGGVASSRPTAGTSSPTGRRPAPNAGSGSNQCGAGIPKGTPISFPWCTETAAAGPIRRADRRGDHLRGQAGRRDQHPAVPEDVQLHRLQLQRRRSIGREVHNDLGASRTSTATPIARTRPRTRSSTPAARSTVAPTPTRRWTS